MTQFEAKDPLCMHDTAQAKALTMMLPHPANQCSPWESFVEVVHPMWKIVKFQHRHQYMGPATVTFVNVTFHLNTSNWELNPRYGA